MLLNIIILFTIIQSTHQTSYSCNRNVSCGCSINSATVSRIVGGEEARPGTWGWAVSISIADTSLCGGSIISSSWVITAAHCVEGYTPSQFTIYAGSNTRWQGTQKRLASRVIAHPGYNPSTYENDIALLRLNAPLIMTDQYLSAICIPKLNSTAFKANEWPPADKTTVAVGWGRLFENGSTPLTLHQVSLTTIYNQAGTCRPLISDANLQFCAGTPAIGKDTCQGDSGGPLMIFTSSKQWVLAGVTSFGDGCAGKKYSGVYTRIVSFENWIRTNTEGAYSSILVGRGTMMQISICYLLIFVLFHIHFLFSY